jgi:hypothetical protein
MRTRSGAGGRSDGRGVRMSDTFVKCDGGHSVSFIYPTLKQRWIQRDRIRYRAVGDCAVRAVSAAYGISYDEAFRILDARQDGVVLGFADRLKDRVWRIERVKKLEPVGRFLCTERRGRHVVAYIDGVRYDLVLINTAWLRLADCEI